MYKTAHKVLIVAEISKKKKKKQTLFAFKKYIWAQAILT